MINQLLSSPPEMVHWVLIIPEKVILNNIMQNLLNLRMNYPRRFLHLSLLLILIYTVHLFGRLVKGKFQERVHFFLEPS